MSEKPAGSGVGRGLLYLALGNVYFIFAGMAIQFGLPAVLPRTSFGAYTLVNSIASLFNNVLVTGTQQAVSKPTAEEPDKARRVQHAGLRMHLRVGLVIAALFIAGAPVTASLLHDPSKTAPLMLAGLIIGGYAFYAVFVGTANGLKQFTKQAGLTIVFATVRAGALIGMAILGTGVIGVIGGWVAAVGFIMILAIAWIGLPGRIPAGEALPVRPMIKFFIGLALYNVLFNALMFIDTVLLKRLMAEHFTAHLAELPTAIAKSIPWAPRAAGYTTDVAALADVQVGYYAAVQNLARLSYQVVLAGAFVVFPLVSSSTFSNDREKTQRYVQMTARYTLIAAGAIAVVMAANPVDVLGIVYAQDFALRGGAALPMLALGNVAFSLIAISGTILNGAGRTRLAVILASGTLVVAAVGNYIAIPIGAAHGETLAVCASVTGGAMTLGAIACAIVLRRQFGAFVPLLSVVRIAFAIAAAMVVGHFLPLHGKLMALAETVVIAVVYVVALVATRELTKSDVAMIKSVRK